MLRDEASPMLYPADNNGLEKEVYGLGDKDILNLHIAETTKNQPPMINEKRLLNAILASHYKCLIMLNLLPDKSKEHLNNGDYNQTNMRRYNHAKTESKYQSGTFWSH